MATGGWITKPVLVDGTVKYDFLLPSGERFAGTTSTALFAIEGSDKMNVCVGSGKDEQVIDLLAATMATLVTAEVLSMTSLLEVAMGVVEELENNPEWWKE